MASQALHRTALCLGLTTAAVLADRVCGRCNPQEIDKLLAMDAGPSDQLGKSSAKWGDTVIVGAENDDDGGSNAGAAYIFRDDGAGDWTQVDKITASDAAVNDNFGNAVSLWGDTAIVGAYHDDDGGGQSGSAYIFRDDGAGNWVQVDKITAGDAAASDQFGNSVAIFGNIALVGAPFDDDGGNSSGSVYFFRDDGLGDWVEIDKITASDAAANDQFGNPVAIDGNNGGIAIVGARLDDGPPGIDTGSAYLFRHDGGDNWIEVDKITASDPGVSDQFGKSVAVYGDTAVVGAWQDDDVASNAGSAYVFREDLPESWVELDKITSSDPELLDEFGVAVAVEGDVVIVGAFLEDALGSASGAAYLFQDDGSGTWVELDKITASDGAAGDELGFAIGLSEGSAVISAHLLGADDAGAAYVFELNCDPCGDVTPDGGDGMVGILDFLHVLATWGTPDGDANGDGTTDLLDLLLVLATWGPC